MGMSMGHLVLLLIIVLVIFGAGKIPQIMGDVAKGLKAFKEGMKDGEKEKEQAKLMDSKSSDTSSSSSKDAA